MLAATFSFTSTADAPEPSEVEEWLFGTNRSFKRSRTHSPTTTRHSLHEKFNLRKKNLDTKFKGRWKDFNETWRGRFMADLFSDLPEDIEMPTAQPQDEKEIGRAHV